MKKLIIALSAIALTCGLQAATVDWTIKITASSTSYASGYTAYLVDASAWDAATISAATFADSSIVLDSASFDSGSGKGSSKTYQTLKAGSTSAGARSVVIDGLANGGTKDVYYVILNTAADPDTYYKWADTLTGRADTGEETLGSNYSIANSTLTSASWTTVGGSSPVPEPTSGLLLVLGMAGLALRRCRRS